MRVCQLSPAILLWALSVGASPALDERRTLTLPITPVPPQRDVHPEIAHQQDINRSLRRFARLTGRSVPTDEELQENLRRRIASIGDDGDLVKRKPEDVTPAKPPVAAHSLGLAIEGRDVGYLVTIQIGTPPRDFSLRVDSAAADFFVGSENCQNCGNHNFLGPKSSTTFRTTNRTFEIRFTGDSVQGNVVRDDVSVAGFRLRSHMFGVAIRETSTFTNGPFDGLFGTAKSTLSFQRVPTPIEAIAKQGLIKPIVSYKLARLKDGNNDGEITFGALDSSKFKSNTLVELKNAISVGQWGAPMDSISVNGQKVINQRRIGILDVGSPLVVASAEDVQSFHNVIDGAKRDGQGGFRIPCHTTASVALEFAGKQFTVDPGDLVDATTPDANVLCPSKIISGTFLAAGEWLFGVPFLKNFYFSTNVDTDTIIFAKLVSNSSVV